MSNMQSGIVIPKGNPGAGGTILLLQKWSHDAIASESIPVSDQEQVIRRTKDESVELEDKPMSSHVARIDQDRFGKIFRRNMPYGTATTGRCSSASAQSRSRWRRCARTWSA
jgi:putative iron-dependent peroxidase